MNLNNAENDLNTSSNIQIVIGDNNENKNTFEEKSKCSSSDYDNKTVSNTSDDIKEISENINNIDLSKDEDASNKENRFESVEKTNDSERKSDGDVSTEDINTELTGVVKKETEDELNKYNFYQYWHVSPDLPLDPEIVQSCGSPKKNCSAEESSFFVCCIFLNKFLSVFCDNIFLLLESFRRYTFEQFVECYNG